MTSYTPYTPSTEIADVTSWAEYVTQEVDMTAIGFSTDEQRSQMGKLLCNAHEATTATVKNYIDSHIGGISDSMNESFVVIYESHKALKEEVKSLRQIVEFQGELLQAYKNQLDKLPADVGSGSFRSLKIPEPPTFSGTDNKMTLEDWLN